MKKREHMFFGKRADRRKYIFKEDTSMSNLLVVVTEISFVSIELPFIIGLIM